MTSGPSDKKISEGYALAREQYAGLGVDCDRGLDTLAKIPLSLHCWQGDDVGGFENAGRGAGRRHRGHGQLSRQGAHRRRAAPRSGQGLSA